MRRLEQLQSELQFLAGAFLAQEVELPQGVLLTVTRVDISRTRRHARVWVSVLPAGRAQETLALLEGHRAELQEKVHATLRRKIAPHITLHLDEGPARAARLDALARSLHGTTP